MEFPVEYIEFAEAHRCRWYETYLESNMYDMHVVVPADKAPNNIILIYEKHYKNWPPRYNWNIVQRCVKHHNPPSTLFYLYVYFVISIQGFYALEHHGGCLIRNRNCLPFVSPWFTIAVLVGSVLLIVLFFFAVFFVAVFVLWFFRSWFPLRFSLTFMLLYIQI